MTAPTLDHTEPIGPQPEPATSGLRPAVRRMLDELDTHYKGADCGSIGDATKVMLDGVSANPSSWGNRGQAGQAVKAYKERYSIPTNTAPTKKPAARTKPPTPRRTAVVQPKPTAAVPPAVQADPPTVVRQPVPQPPTVVQDDPVPTPAPVVRTTPVRRPVVWPVVILAQPAFVAVWSGWVGLGGLTGFGVVHPLPGIWDSLQLNTSITLPIGVETYGTYALYIWLSGRVPRRARRFAMWSAIASLIVGGLGQVAYHLLVSNGVTVAPWQITTLVSILPVAVLGMGAALAHLVREETR